MAEASRKREGTLDSDNVGWEKMLSTEGPGGGIREMCGECDISSDLWAGRCSAVMVAEKKGKVQGGLRREK